MPMLLSGFLPLLPGASRPGVDGGFIALPKAPRDAPRSEPKPARLPEPVSGAKLEAGRPEPGTGAPGGPRPGAAPAAVPAAPARGIRAAAGPCRRPRVAVGITPS